MKYGDWLEIWLENYVKISVKERTFVRYATICLLYTSDAADE